MISHLSNALLTGIVVRQVELDSGFTLASLSASSRMSCSKP